MENFNENEWTTVSRKNKKTPKKIYRSNGTQLSNEEVRDIKEAKRLYKESKHKKNKKQNVSNVSDASDASGWKFQQTNVYGGSDNFNPEENGYRLMTPNDYNLTPDEQALVEKAGYKLFCCLCCDNTATISEIIGRNVYSCGTCYCCIGDDPFGDICKVYVNDKTRSVYMTASKEQIEELAEFNKKYEEEYEKETGHKYIN
jgi:hypothetical protein